MTSILYKLQQRFGLPAFTWRTVLVAAISAVPIACVTEAERSDPSAEESLHSEDQKEICHHREHVPHMTWGEGSQVRTYQEYSISGRPDSKTVFYGRAHGITDVIDLRSSTSEVAKTKTEAEGLGLHYTNIPLFNPGSFSDEIYNAFAATLGAGDDRTYLIIHDRIDVAAAWFALYIATRSSLNTDTALNIAESVGLQDSELKRKLSDFLDPPGQNSVDEAKPVDETPPVSSNQTERPQ